ncbi:MAG TPA: FtsX-like permease family protein [Candidatus Aminicenantes bacterium]|nr:FtsX-like permease family protein [Candidatus Aminicenantes bacterium]
MSLYSRLAWRNIFRNKRRTYITGIAVAVGLAALMFLDALYIGMADNMIAAATASFTGEAQIHGRDFLLARDANLTVAGSERLLADLRNDTLVKAFTPRTLSQGMVTSAANVNPVLLVGVRPDTERALSQMDDVIEAGDYFGGNDPQNIVIGRKLADLLEVGVGDRVVVTVSRAGSGELSQDLFRVSGIYRFNTDDLDDGLAFVRIEKAQDMLGLAGRVNEIALSFKDPRVSQDETHPFWTDYSTGGNEALGWPRLFPALKSVYQMTTAASLILGLLLFTVVALGIVNTMFMSIYERMFEFGVLRAVGTRPGGIRRLVILEAGSLALLSIALGVGLGFLVTLIVSLTGVNYQNIEFAGVTIKELIYPVFHLKQYVLFPAGVLLFTMLVGLYPAGFAARMSVTRAMKRTM